MLNQFVCLGIMTAEKIISNPQLIKVWMSLSQVGELPTKEVGIQPMLYKNFWYPFLKVTSAKMSIKNVVEL
jgi:hypothetical protein